MVLLIIQLVKEKELESLIKNPLYVVKIIADKNEIIVGTKEYLVKTKINLKDLNIITNDRKDFEKELFVKVRSTGRLIKAKINIDNTQLMLIYWKKNMALHQVKHVFFIQKIIKVIKFLVVDGLQTNFSFST